MEENQLTFNTKFRYENGNLIEENFLVVKIEGRWVETEILIDFD